MELAIRIVPNKAPKARKPNPSYSNEKPAEV